MAFWIKDSGAIVKLYRRTMAKLIMFTFILTTLLTESIVVSSARYYRDPSTICDYRVDPRTLRSDQMTVVINGFSEHRIPLLQSIAATYSATASVSSVYILWCNPSTPSQTLTEFSQNLTLHSTINAPVSIIRESSTSLNSRFQPRESLNTRAVLICDDDLEIDSKSIDFAFNVWKSNPQRLVGFFARSHTYDLSTKSWIYTVHSDKFSIVLTKAVIVNNDYLWEYSCGGGEAMEMMKKWVDTANNCEDILMNVMVADKTNAGPVLVGAKKIRDWGDARNEGGLGKEEREVGLSSRRGDHRKRRGECIMEFHRILGRLPLRYSYGKVVNSVGEQALCEKSGKLVLCDQQSSKF